MRRLFCIAVLTGFVFVPLLSAAEPPEKGPTAVLEMRYPGRVVQPPQLQGSPSGEIRLPTIPATRVLELPPIEGKGTRILKGSKAEEDRLAPPARGRTLVEQTQRWLGREF
jgi:hypothetical protein